MEHQRYTYASAEEVTAALKQAGLLHLLRDGKVDATEQGTALLSLPDNASRAERGTAASRISLALHRSDMRLAGDLADIVGCPVIRMVRG